MGVASAESWEVAPFHPARSLMKNQTGTQNWWRDATCIITDGMKEVMERAGAGWLVTDIGVFSHDLKGRYERILFWRLTVKDEEADLEAFEDIPGERVFVHHYEYTDFPEGEWIFYWQDNVLFLPSEY